MKERVNDLIFLCSSCGILFKYVILCLVQGIIFLFLIVILCVQHHFKFDLIIGVCICNHLLN